MKVPLLELRAQYASLRDEVGAALAEVLESQQLIDGPAVARLEEAIASYSGCEFGVGVSSGSDALLAALMALGVGPGDEVITTPYSFFSTVGSVVRLGARPVFVDIDPQTFLLDATAIEAATTDRTVGAIPVHLFGQMTPMQPLLEWAERHGLFVLEDAAQAIGASQSGSRAGSLGAAGCISFFPSKNLGGAGDGGMLVTRDAGLAERVRALRSHGARVRDQHETLGGNFRLDTLQAAYLLVKLPHLDDWSERRRRNAARYDELLAGLDEVRTPLVAEGNVPIFNQYVIRTPKRDLLREHLESEGIGVAVYYPLGLHQQPCFRDLGYAKGDFPEAERAAAESLALPIHPDLTDAELRYVADSIRRHFTRAP